MNNGTVNIDFINLNEIKIARATIDKDAAFKALETGDYSFDIDYSFELGANVPLKKIRIIFFCHILTRDKAGEQVNVKATFEFIYFFTINNLDELTKMEGETPIIEKSLLSSLINIVYSTSRGIIYNHCQGTDLKMLILPVTSTAKLEKIAGLE